jgi:D-alanine-D-alanine ligase
MASRRVVVLGGGRSSEHDVSLESAASVAETLRGGGWDVIPVTIERDGRWRHPDGAAIVLTPGSGALLDADVVFPALHGPFGEDGTIQGLLEMLDVPYVGSGVLGSALTMDKDRTKAVLRDGAIAVTRDYIVRAGDDLTEAIPTIHATLGERVFVKPARLGSSVGISKVTTAEALRPALELALAHDDKVLVEEAVTARELECGVLGNERIVEVSVPGEVTMTRDWYDYEAKYTPGIATLTAPAVVDAELATTLRTLAERAFRLCACDGMARVDFFATDDGRILLNEVNTIPGFTATSAYARLFQASGIAFDDLLERLIGLAIERHERSRALRH